MRRVGVVDGERAERVLLKEFQSILPQLRLRIRRRVLVLGSEGAMGISDELKSRGHEVYCAELDDRSLPYLDASFHAVFLCRTLCKVRSMEESLEEVFRVLKPHGDVLVFQEPVESWVFRTQSRYARRGPVYQAAMKAGGFQPVQGFFPRMLSQRLMNGGIKGLPFKRFFALLWQVDVVRAALEPLLLPWLQQGFGVPLSHWYRNTAIPAPQWEQVQAQSTKRRSALLAAGTV